MSTDRDVTRIVRSWMDEGVTTLPDRVLDLVLDQIPTTPQRHTFWPARRFLPMSNTKRYAVAALVVAAAVIGGFAFLTRGDVGNEPSPAASQTDQLPTPKPSASALRSTRLPGMGLNEPAGEYGWRGGLGSWGGMHKVVGDDPDTRQTQLVFAVENDCFAGGGAGAEPVPVTVAGLDGMYLEPYDAPGVVFTSRPDAEQTTGAYALPIGDGTLCVYLTWDAATTQVELDAARRVVESIRGQRLGGSVIWINFTLSSGWDTG